MANTTYSLAKAFAAIENQLINSMIRNMKKHRADETDEGIQWSQWQAEQLKALEVYRKANKRNFVKRFEVLNGRIEELLRTANAQGMMDQEKAILNAIKNGFTGYKRAGTGITGEFFQTNERKLNALVKATTSDMQKAETAVLRMANDQYRKVIYNAQVFANTGAGSYEQAIDMATKDMLSAGLNCVQYSNGSRRTLSDYADMAIKTANKRAYLQGEGVKRQEWGEHLVIMAKRGNPCPKCLPFVGKILIDDVWSGGSRKDGKYPLMSAAIKAGLYHPRCKDSHTTYFPGITTAKGAWTKEELEAIEKDSKEEARQQYAERQAEKYGRLAEHSLDPENQRKYAARQEEWGEQYYRSVTRGDASKVFIDQEREISVKRVDTYSNGVYISDKVSIKPKALHIINQNTEEALKAWGISANKIPKIVIVSPDEMPAAFGKYDAVQDTVFYIPHIVDAEVIPGGYIERHEMWHLKQAENFRAKNGEITGRNRVEYIKYTCKKAKKVIDRLGINSHNVGEISKYAKQMLDRMRYDEVEAEYMAKYGKRL